MVFAGHPVESAAGSRIVWIAKSNHDYHESNCLKMVDDHNHWQINGSLVQLITRGITSSNGSQWVYTKLVSLKVERERERKLQNCHKGPYSLTFPCKLEL